MVLHKLRRPSCGSALVLGGGLHPKPHGPRTKSLAVKTGQAPVSVRLTSAVQGKVAASAPLGAPGPGCDFAIVLPQPARGVDGEPVTGRWRAVATHVNG
jgi:hypothetical protein